MKKHRFISFLLLVSLATNCSYGVDKYSNPPGYDLNHPVIVELPDQIDEISGIIYYPKDTSVFAIDDGTGYLYKIFPNRKVQIQKWDIGKSHDFEDLQLIDSTFYIMSSNGDLYKKSFVKGDADEVEKIAFPDGSKNEFESLYYDRGMLCMICKNCKGEKKGEVNIWQFDPRTQQFSLAPVVIDSKPLSKRFDKKQLELKPSAAAIDPLRGDLYILSSINKLLVVADRNGKIKAAYPLNPAIYKQPEGITFTPSGDMLISNESADEGPANILVIKIKKAT